MLGAVTSSTVGGESVLPRRTRECQGSFDWGAINNANPHSGNLLSCKPVFMFHSPNSLFSISLPSYFLGAFKLSMMSDSSDIIFTQKCGAWFSSNPLFSKVGNNEQLFPVDFCIPVMIIYASVIHSLPLSFVQAEDHKFASPFLIQK